MKNELVKLDSPKSLIDFSEELKKFIIKQNLFTNIQGKNYVNVEGWQFAGGNLGLFPVVETCERIEKKDSEMIYRASVALYSGERIVSRGIAVCSSKEKGKNMKDEYVIASMAQTRAEGKAYRLILGWLMKVAGYEATPTEEVAPVKDEKPKTPEAPKDGKSGVDYVKQVKQVLFKKGAKDEWKALELLNKLTGDQYNKFSEMTQAQAKTILGKLLRK